MISLVRAKANVVNHVLDTMQYNLDMGNPLSNEQIGEVFLLFLQKDITMNPEVDNGSVEE